MERPNTLAALKRYLKPGVRLMLTEHSAGLNHPIPREVLEVNTQGIEMNGWPGREHQRSWWYFPPAENLTFDDRGFVDDRDSIRMRYEYVDCPHGDPMCPCPDGDACHYVTLSDGSPAVACPRTGKVGCTECN